MSAPSPPRWRSHRKGPMGVASLVHGGAGRVAGTAAVPTAARSRRLVPPPARKVAIGLSGPGLRARPPLGRAEAQNASSAARPSTCTWASPWESASVFSAWQRRVSRSAVIFSASLKGGKLALSAAALLPNRGTPSRSDTFLAASGSAAASHAGPSHVWFGCRLMPGSKPR